MVTHTDADGSRLHHEFVSSPASEPLCFACARPKNDHRHPVLATSDEWCEAFGVTVYDPDGWDRTDFETSWSEEIDCHEFMKRFGRSTVLVQMARTPAEARTHIRNARGAR